MKKTIGILGMAAGAAMMLSSAAFALDSSFGAMSKAGTHKFIVVCTGGPDKEVSQEGASATEAQAAVQATVAGTCHPKWVGLEG